MNMQTIQILFLLVDGIVKLAPWRVVTETMERIGDGADQSLARSLSVIAVVCAGLLTLPPTLMFGAILPAGYLGGAMASHLRLGGRLFSHILPGFYFGLMGHRVGPGCANAGCAI